MQIFSSTRPTGLETLRLRPNNLCLNEPSNAPYIWKPVLFWKQLLCFLFKVFTSFSSVSSASNNSMICLPIQMYVYVNWRSYCLDVVYVLTVVSTQLPITYFWWMGLFSFWTCPPGHNVLHQLLRHLVPFNATWHLTSLE